MILSNFFRYHTFFHLFHLTSVGCAIVAVNVIITDDTVIVE